MNHKAFAIAIALIAGHAHAADTQAKSVVIDRLAGRNLIPQATAAQSDAMAVSVLLESPDGTLRPHSTATVFRTGDRFRVKLLTARDGTVSLYNTNPRGELSREPLWRAQVRAGLERITPRLRLDGTSGVDLLHVVMEPGAAEQPDTGGGLFGWLGRWFDSFKSGTSKDIVLDSQNTDTGTYLVNTTGQGIVSTIRIAHQR